ncbi:hypothetical protein STEG23_013184 [Scotinomys teguina]
MLCTYPTDGEISVLVDLTRPSIMYPTDGEISVLVDLTRPSIMYPTDDMLKEVQKLKEYAYIKPYRNQKAL